MQKRLYRSSVDRKIGGVCGGLGDYFNMDPVIIRALFAIAFFVYGTGLLAYIVLWVIVPSAYHKKQYGFSASDQDRDSTVDSDFNMASKIEHERASNRSNNHNHFIGVALIVIGGIWSLNNFLPNFDFDFIFPILLLGFGIFLLTRGVRNREQNQGDQQ